MIPQRQQQNSQPSAKVSFEQPSKAKRGHRIVLYGPGGIGKSTLGCQLPGKSAIADADESLDILKAQLDEQEIACPVKIKGVSDWQTLRLALQAPGWDGIDNIILDTWSPIEQWATNHCLATIRKDDGQKASDLEDYGFGKGYRRNYDHFLPLLSDLDRHARQGRNICIIAHDVTCNVPNPAGQDFIRWEPKMQHTKEASIRYRIKDWADHVLFLCYDVQASKKAHDARGEKVAKAQGVGSRTLYTAELPHFMAKSRTTCDSFDIVLGEPSPWDKILK